MAGGALVAALGIHPGQPGEPARAHDVVTARFEQHDIAADESRHASDRRGLRRQRIDEDASEEHELEGTVLLDTLSQAHLEGGHEVAESDTERAPGIDHHAPSATAMDTATVASSESRTWAVARAST